MNSEELKNIIENARIAKGISQRELSKLSGISRSTLNDIINGKIKKVDVDSLKKIAEALDLSLQKLLKVAGYDEFLDFLSLDKFKNKPTKDLKELVEQYKKSELDLLDFDSKKRNEVRKTRFKMFDLKKNLVKIKENKNDNYTLDDAIKELEKLSNNLEPVLEKYDYSKLPNDN
ncbi:MAG: helix-turn-helix transcriptional regulator [Bacilli bacterium]